LSWRKLVLGNFARRTRCLNLESANIFFTAKQIYVYWIGEYKQHSANRLLNAVECGCMAGAIESYWREKDIYIYTEKEREMENPPSMLPGGVVPPERGLKLHRHAWGTSARVADTLEVPRSWQTRKIVCARDPCSAKRNSRTAGYFVISSGGRLGRMLDSINGIRRFIGGENPAALSRGPIDFSRRAAQVRPRSARVSRLSLLARCI